MIRLHAADAAAQDAAAAAAGETWQDWIRRLANAAASPTERPPTTETPPHDRRPI